MATWRRARSPPLCGIFDSGRSIGLPPDWPRLHALRHPPARFEEVWPQHNSPFPQNCRVNENSLPRSDKHTSDLQSLTRISYAVFCLTINIAYHIRSISMSHRLTQTHTTKK